MSNPLVPCAACARHVRASSSECPFCGAARSPVETPAFEGPMPRLSRAMAFAFGATILATGAALDGCVENAQPAYGVPFPDDSAVIVDGATDAAVDAAADAPVDAPADATVDAAPVDAGDVGVRYGAPPPDAG